MAHHIFAVGNLQPAIQQTGQAFRFRKAVYLDAWIALMIILCQLQAAIGRAVVQHQYAPVLESLHANTIERSREVIDAVLDRQ
ncbi:hypothetical protein D3C81_1947080 [compost metagenome]